MTEDQVLELFESCSNAGRWGPDDEMGTLRHISPATLLAALSVVKHGSVVSIGKDLVTVGSRQQPPSALHVMAYVGDNPDGASDFVGLMPHGFEMTHLDAIGHAYFRGEIYNGRRASEVVTPAGLRFGSVMAAKDGIVTRGVLLDVAATRGVDFVPVGEGISVADLEQAEVVAGTRVRSGDAIFVRSGHDVRERATGWHGDVEREGVLPEVLPWLHQRQVAVYSGDCIERLPSGYDEVPLPLHQIGLVAMGLAILDIPDVETLREACHRFGQHEFLLVVAPLRIPGGTGSAVNPLAIF